MPRWWWRRCRTAPGVHQLGQVARGARTVLLPGERLDVEEALRLIEQHRVTNMFTVPTILKSLAEHEAARRARPFLACAT